MPSIQLYIQVGFRVVGFHHYSEASESVHYLRHHHRHEFHFLVTIEVGFPDRELEFHTVKRRLQEVFAGELDFGEKSCESIAEDVVEKLIEWYGLERTYKVSVSEDGENAGIASYKGEPWNSAC